MKRISPLLIVSLAALLLLTGCASNKSESSMWEYPAATGAAQEPEFSGGYGEEGVSPGQIHESGAGKSPEELYGGRKVILNYDISLQTDDFDGVLQAIQQRLSEYGGYAQSRTVDGKKPSVYGDSGRTARFTLRVPAGSAEAFLGSVEGLGTLLHSSSSSDDITDAYFDTDARLAVLKTELERLTSILVQTDNLADVITLESRISEVMLEIEQLTGTLKKYDALVAYSTVEITLYEDALKAGPAAAKTAGQRMGEGFVHSLSGVGAFFTNVFVWFVSALPVLAVLGAFAAAAGFLLRWIIRRGAKNRAKAAVRQQALYEQQKAYYEQQAAAAAKVPEAPKGGNGP